MNFADRVRKINKIKKLLKDLSVKTKEDALILASRYNHKEIVKLLLDDNVDIDVKDNEDWTALMLASRKNYKEIVKLLLDNNANVNFKNKYGKTALMIACHYNNNNKEIINLLKKYGAKE